MADQAGTGFDVLGELHELQTLFRSAADRCPQLRGAFMLDKNGKVVIFTIGRPPEHFDGQIMIEGVSKDEFPAVGDLMMLCRRGGLVLRHCLRAFPQSNDAAMRDFLRANVEPDDQWIGFLCDKMAPYLSVHVAEAHGEKITRAWFDAFGDVSAQAVAWLTNRWLMYGVADDREPLKAPAKRHGGKKGEDEGNGGNGDLAADATPEKKAAIASENVQLFGRGEQPMVKGKRKPALSNAAYDVVCT